VTEDRESKREKKSKREKGRESKKINVGPRER